VALLVTPEELEATLGLTGEDSALLTKTCEAADVVVRDKLDPSLDHDLHAQDREAALAVAVQIWQARSAPGGQMVGADFGTYVSPHLLGPGLLARVNGLIAPCRMYGGVVIG